MVGEGRVIMRVKELRRVSVIRQTMEKKLTQVMAGTLLGLAHQGRGTPSNRRTPEPVKTKALTLYEQRYGDFGPTLAAEKLAEHHGISISDETLRRWLRAAGIDHFARRTRPHRAWRERKAHTGELIQRDGSHHDWFEGRGPRCVLMAYIDDASSRVYARFYAYEGTIPAKDFTIAHQGGLYQIHETIRASHVLVEERVNGGMRITHQGRTLSFHAMTSRPMKAAEVKQVPRPRRPVTPRPDHPWRRRRRPERRTQATAANT